MEELWCLLRPSEESFMVTIPIKRDPVCPVCRHWAPMGDDGQCLGVDWLPAGYGDYIEVRCACRWEEEENHG